MGVMNVVASFFGGMPMCHGAGGFAGQYYFGARTGGAPIMEGLIEFVYHQGTRRACGHMARPRLAAHVVGAVHPPDSHHHRFRAE